MPFSIFSRSNGPVILREFEAATTMHEKLAKRTNAGMIEELGGTR
jgi:hypothetical protein